MMRRLWRKRSFLLGWLVHWLAESRIICDDDDEECKDDDDDDDDEDCEGESGPSCLAACPLVG